MWGSAVWTGLKYHNRCGEGFLWHHMFGSFMNKCNNRRENSRSGRCFFKGTDELILFIILRLNRFFTLVLLRPEREVSLTLPLHREIRGGGSSREQPSGVGRQRDHVWPRGLSTRTEPTWGGTTPCPSSSTVHVISGFNVCVFASHKPQPWDMRPIPDEERVRVL